MFVMPMMALVASVSVSSTDWIVASGTTGCDATDVDFSDARHGIASCAFSSAMTTTDGGLTWSVRATGLQQSLVFAHARSPSELFLARMGLYRSLDGGGTWVQIPTPAGSGVSAVHFAGSRWNAIQSGWLTYSADAGSTWNVGFEGQNGVYFDELHFPDANVGFATGGLTSELGSIGSVLRTENGGASWTILPFPHGQVTAAHFRSATNGVAATFSSNIYTTSNGGASWQLVSALPDGAYLLDLVQRDATHWYGASLSGCIYETFDAGLAWRSTYCSPNAHALSAITLAHGAAVVVGNYGQVLYENRIFRDGFSD